MFFTLNRTFYTSSYLLHGCSLWCNDCLLFQWNFNVAHLIYEHIVLCLLYNNLILIYYLLVVRSRLLFRTNLQLFQCMWARKLNFFRWNVQVCPKFGSCSKIWFAFQGETHVNAKTRPWETVDYNFIIIFYHTN